MRLTIFGGTGPTGRLVIDQACAAGHEVVAYARTPVKLPSHERLSVVQGQLDDAAAISAAIDGSDAVLSVLGPGTRKADVAPLTTGYRNIVAAMRTHGVARLVAIGTPSITHPDDGKDWKIGLLVAAIKTLQPAAYRALVDIGDIIKCSGLDWTIVRVPFLTNGPVAASVTVRAVGGHGGIRLSRANAARFLLEAATGDGYVRQAPFISDT